MGNCVKLEVPPVNLSPPAAAAAGALAQMFVAGDSSNLLTDAEKAEDIAIMQAQLALYPNQLGPGNAMSGLLFKDHDGNHMFLSFGGKDQGFTTWVRQALGNGTPWSWIRAARFGYIDPESKGNVQQLYDVGQLFGADTTLTRGYTPGGVQPPSAMLNIGCDLADGSLFPGGASLLGLLMTTAVNTDLVRGYDTDGNAVYRVTEQGDVLPSASFVPRATGGLLNLGGSNLLVHRFVESGSFVLSADTTVDIFVLGGGGGGGSGWAGGGGGGGKPLIELGVELTAGTYTVTVGSGGAAQTNGGDSQFAARTAALGGGAGGHFVSAGDCDGGDGASGGGGALGPGGNSASVGGASTMVGGFAGGGGYQGIGQANYSGGGGGGAGAAGGTVNPATPNLAGAGGSGIGSNFDGTWRFYGGGGGGGNAAFNGVGGTRGLGGGGGGGNGGQDVSTAAVAGTDSLGGGGGGSGNSTTTGALGGKGLVMVRYSAMP